MRTRFADTLEEITRIQRRPPPMVALPLLDDTRVSRPWVNEPIHAHVGPMEHHVIAPTLRGDGFSAVRAEGRTIRTPSITGGVTIAPRGFSGDFDCDGRPLASNVFLSRARLQRAADELHSGRTAELLPRLNFDDPRLFSILQLISSESSHPGLHARLWFEQLVDLLCLQLLRAHSVFPASAAEGGAGLARWQVQRVTGYMMDRLGEPLGLQELADLVGLSRFHFCKAFRIASGFTPHQWLVRRRMDEARRPPQGNRLKHHRSGPDGGLPDPLRLHPRLPLPLRPQPDRLPPKALNGARPVDRVFPPSGPLTVHLGS